MNMSARFASRIAGSAIALWLAVFAPCAAAADEPPTRVARINPVDGEVSFSPSGSLRWFNAVANRPLTSGDRIRVEAGRAELQLGAMTLRLEGPARLDLPTVGSRVAGLHLAEGKLRIRLREAPAAGEMIDIETPNLVFSLHRAGDYRIDTEPSQGSTTITVHAGSGTAIGAGGVAFRFDAGQQISFAGKALQQLSVSNTPSQDVFDAWALARDRREDALPAGHHVPRAMVGYQQLDEYGDWRSDPTHGLYWIPRLDDPDWMPFRDGSWEWIPPWGWSWISAEPWDFAPSHYGRWLRLDGEWAWLPGLIDAEPVYSPHRLAEVSAGLPPPVATERGTVHPQAVPAPAYAPAPAPIVVTPAPYEPPPVVFGIERQLLILAPLHHHERHRRHAEHRHRDQHRPHARHRDPDHHGGHLAPPGEGHRGHDGRFERADRQAIVRDGRPLDRRDRATRLGGSREPVGSPMPLRVSPIAPIAPIAPTRSTPGGPGGRHAGTGSAARGAEEAPRQLAPNPGQWTPAPSMLRTRSVPMIGAHSSGQGQRDGNSRRQAIPAEGGAREPAGGAGMWRRR